MADEVMAPSPAVHGTNPGIARKLASTDKGTREKAVALLVLWLSGQREIGEEELKKIWKGLFYCVWHADKAPVQAELIERLAGLLESVEVELSVSFFKVFLSTMRREWSGIDRLRIDKFYLLLRTFLSHMFKVLENGGWEPGLVKKFTDALVERSFLTRDRFAAMGVNLHVADIFWDEFRKFLPVPDGTLGHLLEPFYSILSTSSDKALLKRVRENVFVRLLEDARALVGSIEKKRALNGTNAKLGYLLNSTAVGPRLFELASSASSAQANRKVLYELSDEFSKLAKSLDALKDAAMSSSGSFRDSLQQVPSGSTKSLEEGLPESTGGSRARLRKRQARAAVLDVETLDQDVIAVKVRKTKRIKENFSLISGDREDGRSTRSGEGLDSVADGKDKQGIEKIVTKTKRSSKVSATAKADVLLKKKPVKRKKEKMKKAGQARLVSLSSLSGETEAARETGVSQPSSELASNGHQGVGVRDPVIESDISGNGLQDISEVSLNLKRKFDFVAAAAGEAKDAGVVIDTSASGAPVGSSSEILTKRKRKKGKASIQGMSGSENGSNASPAVQPPVKAGADEQAPREVVKRHKKVRFSLKNNLICKPHSPLPPLALRTPPAATPRGSALKSGVLPGPIRTRPIRIVRNTRLKAKRRAARQLLTISLQKTKSSSRRVKKKPSR